MCDAWVAQKDVTRNRTVLFAKNSDRPSGECQVLYCGSPRKPNGKRAVRCSYVEVEDDAGALATIGCRPYWCWGYETGLNEAGVVGGNTAIFTRSLHLKEESKPLGLTGMDLLRFGLERGDTAEKAVEAIIDLLSRFGQWGSAVQGKDHDEGSYENAFLVADGKESWILETSGRRWIARQANNGFLALSNQPTIRDEWTNTSPNLQDFAADMGWWRPETGAFDFARDFGDHEHYSRQVSHIRWRRVVQLLDTARGNIDVPWMMRMLRDHLEGTFLCGPQFHPFLPDFHTICMHDSPAGFTWGNTATSVIIEIDPSRHLPPRLWIAYQPPCVSVYVGFSWTDALPELLTRAGKADLDVRAPCEAPADEFESLSLWWRLYRLVRAVGEAPATRYPEVRKRFVDVEKQSFKAMDTLRDLDEQLERITGTIERLEKAWHLE